ncbi:MAG: LCP family protein [Candidatus Margulisbacteria bacterium]|nr:LCP family protein [Candidatus Margulisiibacteriota bacterium]
MANKGVFAKKNSISSKVIIAYVASFFVTIIVGFYFGLLVSQWNFINFLLHVLPQTQVSPADNILVLGIDDVKGIGRSDTIMVVNVNRATKKIGLLSIPRDSRVNIKGHGLDKINHAYAYGGINLVKETLTELLQTPIKYHVVLKLGGVKDIINEIGGVDIDVQKRMYYMDKAGDLYIDFKPGQQEMNGEQATSFLRFRHDEKGDIGRIGRQQQFIKAVISKMLMPQNLVKLPKLISEKEKYVDTNLSVGQMLGLAVEFKDSLESGKLNVNTLPGAIMLVDGLYYWRIDLASATKMIDETLHGFNEINIVKKEVASSNIKLANKNFGKPKMFTLVEIKKFMPEEKTAINDNIFEKGLTISVEVLNGNGVTGSAAVVAELLKKRGVVVARVENGAHFQYENTVLVDWKGKTSESLRLAKAMNINPANIIMYSLPAKTIDMCLVLGKDWEKLTGVKTQ